MATTDERVNALAEAVQKLAKAVYGSASSGSSTIGEVADECQAVIDSEE